MNRSFPSRKHPTRHNFLSHYPNPLKVILFLVLGIFHLFTHAQGDVTDNYNCTLTVTSTNDSGIGSLRNVVANACSGALIKFANYLENDSIVLTSGEIHLVNPVTIEGLGAEKLTISATGNSRIFYIETSEDRRVKISNLTIKRGNAMEATTHRDKGGAIYNDGNLTIEDCILRENNMTINRFLEGGAIYNAKYLTVRSSLITENRLYGYTTNTSGGGIYNVAFATIEDSKFEKNWTGGPGSGGAIHNTGTLAIVNTSIVDNFAGAAYVKTGGRGGGIYSEGGRMDIVGSTFNKNFTGAQGGAIMSAGTYVTITNTTISDNEAYVGGGILISDGSVNIVFSTITNNRAEQKERANPSGGGIVNGGFLRMSSSIIAKNWNQPANEPHFTEDIVGNGTVNSEGYNLIGVNTMPISPSVGDIFGTVNNPIDPMLEALADNGGNTLTHALSPGSVALNAANPASTITTDQRGYPRPYGYRSDIGAFERGVSGCIVTNTNDDGPGSLRQVVSLAPPGCVITFATHLEGDSIVLTSGDISIVKTLTIQGLGKDKLIISGNDQSRIFKLEHNLNEPITITNLTLKRGFATEGGTIYNEGKLLIESCRITQSGHWTSLTRGGGIYNSGDLRVNKSEITHNSTGSYTGVSYGGGIYNVGTTHIEESLIADNWSGGPGIGGGIYHAGQNLDMKNTSVANNFAGSPPVKAGGAGGGMAVTQGNVNIEACAFTENISGYGGGALQIRGGIVNIINSTISNNNAFYGGGIHIENDAVLNMSYSTLVKNSASQKERIPPGGGGIWNTAHINIGNNIIADNISIPANSSSYHSDIEGNGTTASQGYNIIGAKITSIVPSLGDLYGTTSSPINPMLGDLALNDGITQTHALLDGSPALDAANPTSFPTRDQRGFIRPFGGRADIGAYEFSLPTNCESNIALNRPVTASSTENGSHLPHHAVDGNLNTRWASEWDDSEWIYVDLGQSYNLCKVVLKWETAYAKAFRIEVSDDATNWTTIATVNNNNTRTNVLDNLTGSGRYVRMYGISRATQWGYSLYEFEVYGAQEVILNTNPVVMSANFDVDPQSSTGTPVGVVEAEDADNDNLTFSIQSGNTDNAFSIESTTGLLMVNNSAALVPGNTFRLTVSAQDDGPGNLEGSAEIIIRVNGGGTCASNIALYRTVVASSEEDDDFGLLPAYSAVDGDPNTRWSSEWNDPQWIYVDLGATYQLCKVVLKWEQAYARDFRIEVSDDAQNWDIVRSINSNNSHTNNIDNLNVSGRYVRMYGTRRATQYGYSLYEFEVYGSIQENRPPVVQTPTFEIDPYSPNGSLVGQIQASDPDGDNIRYWFVGGNDGALIVDTYTGVLRVYNSSLLTPGREFRALMRAVDDSPANLQTNFTLTIRVRSVQDDCESNLALNRPAVASSEENDDHGLLPASYAVDGNPNTRWSSVWSDPQWIYVDLGAKYELCKVVLRWEAAKARDYRIEVSDDAQNWQTIHTVYGNSSEYNSIENLNGSGRYVRMYGTRRTSQWGYSLYEFEVYGRSVSTRMGREISASTDIQLNIFPNPALNDVNVAFEMPENGSIHIDIFSLGGQKVFSSEHDVITGYNELNLNIDMLPAGMYILKAYNEQINESKRLIIAK